MPITPKFKLSQNDEFVVIRIRVPYVKTSSSELVLDGCDFTFYCRPYLLKIRLPFRVVDDERCRATVDLEDENGTITAYLPKESTGQHFPELDLSTKLMSLRVADDRREALAMRLPSIEVLSSVDLTVEDTTNDQTQHVESSSGVSEISLSQKQSYGFNMKYSNVLGNLREVFFDLIELPSPDTTPMRNRRELRLATEMSIFDGERYLGDFFGAEEDLFYIEALRFSPHWGRQWDSWSSTARADATFDVVGGFNESEMETMQNKLPKREYIVNEAEKKSIMLVLVDILYAYAFDHRITQGESNVESAHNLTRMSAALSWLEPYNNAGDDLSVVVKQNVRRALIYPYIRHWKLASKVLGDVAKIMLLGKRCILRALLQIRTIFEVSETHYILNKLFIDDYCVWLQQQDSEIFESFGEQYNAAKSRIDKAHVDLPVLDLEKTAINYATVSKSSDDDDDDDVDDVDDVEDETSDETGVRFNESCKGSHESSTSESGTTISMSGGAGTSCLVVEIPERSEQLPMLFDQLD
jgi:protein SHQ1